MPAAVEQRVVLVQCEAGLLQLEQALFGNVSASNGSSNGSGNGSSSSDSDCGNGSAASDNDSSSSSSSEAPRGFGNSDGSTFYSSDSGSYRLVVGLDCEWQPYERGEPHTCVSLLQLATPEAVFLLDMVALCGGGDNDARVASGAAPVLQLLPGSSASAGDDASVPEVLPAPLPPVQRRLSELLLRLFGDADIIKAGFGLGTDLSRLCESYPALPCFGSQGPVPLRWVAAGAGLRLLLRHCAVGCCVSCSVLVLLPAQAPEFVALPWLLPPQVSCRCPAAGVHRTGRRHAAHPPPYEPHRSG
jgi:hypothetical protein